MSEMRTIGWSMVLKMDAIHDSSLVLILVSPPLPRLLPRVGTPCYSLLHPSFRFTPTAVFPRQWPGEPLDFTPVPNHSHFHARLPPFNLALLVADALQMADLRQPVPDTDSPLQASHAAAYYALPNKHRFSEAGPSPTRCLRRNKAQKVTRAYDACKTLKVRCSGTIPCDRWMRMGRGSQCQYEAEYRRGKPVVPGQRPSQPDVPVVFSEHDPLDPLLSESRQQDRAPRSASAGITQARDESEDEACGDSPASPGVGACETQGQYYDTISGLTFLHRAVARLSNGRENEDTPETPRSMPGGCDTEDSPTLTVGDKPMGASTYGHIHWPPMDRVKQLLRLYFDVCIASYRFLHFDSLESWAGAMA